MIYETLKSEIYSGVYSFNDKLVISHLAKRFNSSEIPVREALNQLTADGLIDFRPHIGAVVNNLSKTDIKNIFELRIVLEGLATRLATLNLTAQKLTELQIIHELSIKAIDRQDYNAFSQYNTDFHMKIYENSNNELLVKMITDLWKNTNRYPSVFHSNLNYVKLSALEHEEILKYLIQKDSVSAELIMVKHKTRAAREILKTTDFEGFEDVKKEHVRAMQLISSLSAGGI